MIKKLFTCFFLIVLFSNSLYCQDNKNSKAVKFHYRALQYYNASAYDEALVEVERAIKADKNYIQSWLLAGDIQSLKGRKQEAIKSYKTAIVIDSTFFVPAYYILANLLFDQQEYSESIKYYNKYSKYPRIKDAEKARLNKNLEIARFRLHAMNNPVPFKPVNIGANVNTAGYEFVNYISPDRSRLFFTRRMMTGERRDEQFFYTLNLGDTAWSPSIDIGPPINTQGDEGALTLSPDGQFLFFSGCNNMDGYGSCDLYASRLLGDKWGEPVNLGSVVNSSSWESQPSFSSDGRTLYFVSNRPGGKGSSDIWITKLQNNGEWSTPYNAGDVINTSEAERGPFIHPDGVTMYFSSKGHVGMGQGDIFYSTLNDGEWSKPVNIGYPVNTEDDEVTMIVDNEGKYAYYSSAREEGFGLTDMYQFELPETVKPRQVSYMTGIVYDSITKIPLQAEIKLLDPQTGDTIIETNSNKGDGGYFLVIPAGNNYALNVERKGYLFYSAYFQLKGENTLMDPLVKDIPLKPIREGESIVLRNIFFATDSFNLLPESKAELDNLVRIIQGNKGMITEISGHTDDVGSDEYNMVLSEKRAMSVYTYLVKAGVEPSRLRYKGYGTTKPVVPNDSPENRALNRRTEMLIIQMN
jgi:outer membrane protein OmpA-like peptidoglycan-associated protein